MSDLMQEVDDDLRRQQLEQFWRENRLWILGGVVLAILTTGGMAAWRSYDYSRDMKSTSSLLEVSATADSEKLQTYAVNADASHGMLARFAAANMHLQRGEKDKALAIFSDIEKSRADKIFRDLAALYSVSQRISDGEPGELHDRLKPLLKDGNVWRFSALELEALLLAREGKMAEAADKLSYISGDAAAPQDVRTRAFTLRELYAGNAASAPAKTEGKK